MIALELEAKSPVIENSIETANKSIAEYNEQFETNKAFIDAETEKVASQVHESITILKDKWNYQLMQTRNLDDHLTSTRQTLLLLQTELSSVTNRIDTLSEILKEKQASRDLSKELAKAGNNSAVAALKKEIDGELEQIANGHQATMLQIGEQMNSVNEAVERLLAEDIEMMPGQENKLLGKFFE